MGTRAPAAPVAPVPTPIPTPLSHIDPTPDPVVPPVVDPAAPPVVVPPVVDPAAPPVVTPPVVDPVVPPVVDPVVPPVVDPIVPPVVDPVVPPADPGEYVLTLSENSLLTEADLDVIANKAGELGLNKQQAEYLITNREEAVQSAANSIHAHRTAAQKAQYDKIVNDPVFGGDKITESYKTMGIPVQKFGDEGLAAFLKSPEGNNIHFARFLYNLGNAMKSDGFHGRSGILPKEETHGDALRSMYPSFYKNQT